MNAATVSCAVISGLLGRWYDSDLPEGERDAYEQHLLLCPPCLVRSENYRTAITALPGAARTVPDGTLRADLLELVTRNGTRE
jgi:hypothetical protein